MPGFSEPDVNHIPEDVAFPITSAIVKVLGVLRPITYTSYKKSLYNFYSFFIYFSALTVVVSEVLFIAKSEETLKVFLENIYVLSSNAAALFKSYIIISNGRKVFPMISMCTSERWNKPLNLYEEEVTLVQNSREFSRYIK